MEDSLEVYKLCLVRWCYRFQSLFSWMFFSKGGTITLQFELWLFQSLFSWMFFSKDIAGG